MCTDLANRTAHGKPPSDVGGGPAHSTVQCSLQIWDTSLICAVQKWAKKTDRLHRMTPLRVADILLKFVN